MTNGSDLQWLVKDELEAILRIWKGITFESNNPTVSKNPFGVLKAEDDVLGTLEIYYSKLPVFRDIEQLCGQAPLLVFGAPGTGKTAMIFQLMHTGLDVRGKILDMGFPVYFPTVKKTPPNIQSISRAIADTLVAFFSHNPRKFLDLQEQNMQSIVYLWVKLIADSDSLFVKLREAGLSTRGLGAEMIAKISELMNGISNSSKLSDDQCLDMLRRCCPSVRKSIQVFLDWQFQKPPYNRVEELLQSMAAFALSRVYLSVFMSPGTDITPALLIKYPHVKKLELNWRDQPDHLRGLLKARLRQNGEDSLAAWCNPEAKMKFPHVEDGLINVSDGQPAELIRKGNLIFNRWVGKQNSGLSCEDLRELIGIE
jgi:hypothetical protein